MSITIPHVLKAIFVTVENKCKEMLAHPSVKHFLGLL